MTELEKLVKETSDSLELFTGDVKHVLDYLAAQGKIIPDGWQAVPKDLTDGMLNAAMQPSKVCDMWEAMLAAAPKPFESEEE